MLTIILFFFVLSILVLIHEFGHFIAAKRAGVYVEEFGLGLPPRVFGVKYGETLYSLNLLPFGGFVKVLGEEEHELSQKKIPEHLVTRTFAYKKPWQKSIIIASGVICNFLLGWLIISFLFTQGLPVPTTDVRVEQVVAGSPAANAGLKKNDIIKTIRYQKTTIPITSPEDLVSATKRFANKEVSMTVARKHKTIIVSLTPRKNPPKDEGSLGIGISNIEIKKFSYLEAPFLGLVESARITYLTLAELLKTLFRAATFQKIDAQIAGPIGIAVLTREAASYGYLALLQLMGILSLNLAVINILPFPALDGGRLALVLYEWVSGRKVNQVFEKRLNIAGFTILLSFIIIITIRDIVKLL